MGRRTVALVVAALVVAGAAAAGTVAVRRQQHQQTLAAERAAVEGFLTAWRTGKVDGVAFTPGTLTAAPVEQGQPPATTAAARLAQITARLTAAKPDVPARATLLAIRETTRDRAATGSAELTWTLPGGASWTYRTEVPVLRQGDRWLVSWSDQLVHPGLADGRVLVAERTVGERAGILGADDVPLVSDRPVVIVMLDPRRVKDPAATVSAVSRVLGVDAASLRKRLDGAKGNLVDVITLRREAYLPLRDRVRPIPGVVFRETSLPLAESPTFARALLGSVGPATAEAIAKSGGRIQLGDLAGSSGLQARYDEQLAGRAGVTVTQVLPGSDAALPPLLDRPAQDGTPLRTSIDLGVQRAAEDALAAAPEPAALVAIRPSTGEVLAVANGGPNGSGYNRAMLGQYPPGSTFKVASALALLEHGERPDDPVACPPTVTVSGKTFRNAEGEVLGTVPFHSAFAHSCNTAFVGSASKVDEQQLADAAGSLGIGLPEADPLGTSGLGATVFAGQVPTDGDPVQHAAQMIGQGKLLVSPLVVARMSAAVAAGRLMPARLVLADDAPAPGPALPQAPVTALRSMMREVVTAGTATALKGVPGGPVSGKTGTAEFGSGNPPPTHAWFTGFRGDLAFAVVVEGGGFGGKVAAPLAGRFLAQVPTS